MYPTDVLPTWLRQVADAFPITHALKGLRAAMLEDARVATVLPEITVLALFAAVGLPISITAFNFGLRRARITGTLGHQ
jgi:ABC-2 type transport system permease protein